MPTVDLPRYVPAGYTVGTTYALGDLPTAEETGGASFTERFTPTFAESRNFRAIPSGEKRPPKRGEWYLSGAIVTAYRAPNDLETEFLIAKLVKVERIPAREVYRIITPA